MNFKSCTALAALALLFWSPAFAQQQTSATTCSGTFTPISATAYVDALTPGWNLGNTLDAIPNEGSWNNPPVVATTFQDIKAAGFKSVRIPVTYADHFVGGSPGWPVANAWLDRVSDVVDMATASGLYVVTNVHHDSWQWADVTKSGANITSIQEQFYRLWYQIGTRLACKSSLVSFETINEPPSEEQHAQYINQFNEIFLRALEDSGGFNTQRVVTLVGPSMDPTKTSRWFKPPAVIKNPWALQFHFYGPYDFIFGAWGRTIWGNDVDKAAVTQELSVVRGNFTDVPLVLGEFDASPLNTEPAARWKWTDHVARLARDLHIALIIWDNGVDHFDRNDKTWRDPVTFSIIREAWKGVPNSLPDSTTDQGAPTQSSSAFLWGKVRQEVTDQTLPWLFNGNTLTSIETNAGTTLMVSRDYTTSASSIAFKADFLRPHFTGEPGSKANLTLTFSAGSSSNIEIILWDTPVMSSSVGRAVANSELPIPLDYNGWKMVAAVKAVTASGRYLFDDWTQWLGPLQQARSTFNSHWYFDGARVVLTTGMANAVIAAGEEVVLTFEFYPRMPGNSVEYRISA